MAAIWLRREVKPRILQSKLSQKQAQRLREVMADVERDRAKAEAAHFRELLEEACPRLENHPRSYAKRLGAEIRSILEGGG